MSLKAPTAVVQLTTSDILERHRGQTSRYGNDEVNLVDKELTDEALADLLEAATTAGDKSFGRMIASIQAARTGDFSKSVPKLRAAPGMVLAYLQHEMIDGWVYRREQSGFLSAYLVTDVDIITPRNDEKEYLTISLVANNSGRGGTENSNRDAQGLGVFTTSVSFNSELVVRKKVGDILIGGGLFKETPELRAEYDRVNEAYADMLSKGFAKQFRFTGTGIGWREEHRENHKVIHDIKPGEIPAFAERAESALFGAVRTRSGMSDRAITRTPEEIDDDDTTGEVPTRPMLRVFDLHTQDLVWVNAMGLKAYVYDKSIGDKLILPEDQRELLDILTSDIDAFTSDIVEGKSAGNVILCKGKPGLGKTLSAEAMSEIVGRPLYSIHSGSLGTKAEDIRKNLEVVFTRVNRWDAILLLDEADVFVKQRGDNIEQNAIVAEFLRTMEYFTGLFFMTTNRPDDIDDAIISRSAAIIDYRMPEADDARRIWNVLATNNGVEIDPALLEELLVGFAHISPRDIKMLLRLTLRVAASKQEKLSTDLFRRCAMFRGLHFDKNASVVA